jgi:hypothetical protein
MARWTAAVGLMLALALAGRTAHAQATPFEEAQKRLQQRLSTRPAATQPVSELERLREENTRLRVRVAELQSEVSALRESMPRSNASSTTRPSGPASSRPGNAAPSPLVGQWRGGDIARGAGFVLEFSADGSYRRTFLNYPQREAGSYRMLDPQTVEMWTNTAPEDRPHNQYRVNIGNGELILTPLVVDGVEVRRPTPLVLTKAQ